ncbi:uncharacterized protein CXQ87_003377 [Candidozyma duobushaemuli]|uniref:Amidase domain-containing protein n=2 Tax=Candidozyma TaxID=3303203 RepID=A0ABX8I6L1_9ASCO|nr:uncharacterized protein CXQ87_003377 [[Candida] duobushaemulonis]PVH15535.1 hypothetical protein CXQ87_003377 [[Candida] duobushaemulonis]QWU88742.1 hypothetical protein CA3LBN_003050 [[Candida] haemuloni]
MTWHDLAKRATDIYDNSLKKTLELFPLDDEALKEFESLPSARGKTVEDYGSPAKVPIDVFREKMPEKSLAITEKDPCELLQDLKSGKVTCVQVLTAYFHAAIFASKLVNCIYEFLPEEAMALAKMLDSGDKNLPLYGLPLSLKEMIPFKGRAVTHGSLCYLDRVVDYNADIVNILVSAGAVPFVRTTNPQSLMMLECESWTHGRTVNPYNSSLTCGGSTGGEGALHGIGASAFGLGSDIGGSIRCPSAFNGIYGLRSTVGRLPSSDYFSCQLGSESILSVTGPMTRSLALLDLVMKTITDSSPWLVDPSLYPLPWKAPKKEKLKIGILYDDGLVAPQPPVARALKMVAEQLSKMSNVEVVPFKPYKHDKAWEIITSLYFEDGGADTRSTMERSGEPMLPQTEWILTGKHVKPLEPKGIWSWNIEKVKYRKEYLAHWLSQGAPDAVIAPVFPGPACKPRTSRYWGYTAQWNLLDYPGMAFPVTTVDPDLDAPVKDYKPRNEMDEFVWKQYDSAESFANAPVALCAVGLRNSDETVVEVAKILEKK